MAMCRVDLTENNVQTLDKLFDSEPFSISETETDFGVNHKVHYPLEKNIAFQAINPHWATLDYNGAFLSYNEEQFVIFSYFEMIPKEVQKDVRERISRLNPSGTEVSGLDTVVKALDYIIDENQT